MTVTPWLLHLVGRLARKRKPGRKPRAEQVKALLAYPSMSVLFCIIPIAAISHLSCSAKAEHPVTSDAEGYWIVRLRGR